MKSMTPHGITGLERVKRQVWDDNKEVSDNLVSNATDLVMVAETLVN
jgi:hypothetical protein